MAHVHYMLDNLGYKHTHSGCVILIIFPLQQWLHGPASLLRYMYIDCPLSYVCKNAFDIFIRNLLQTKSSRGIFRQLWDTRVVITRNIFFFLISFISNQKALYSGLL